MENELSFISKIKKRYNVKLHILIFIIVVIIFQILAFFTHGDILWFIGDYLWYVLIFLGLIESIEIAKRAALQNFKHSYKSKLELYRDMLFDDLEFKLKAFDVEVKGYYMLENKKIKSDIFENRLSKMRQYHDSTLLEINKFIGKRDKSLDKRWNNEIYTKILNLNEILDSDIVEIAQTKTELNNKVENYNRIISEYKELVDLDSKTLYENYRLQILPFLLSIIIAIQLGNITNRLLEILN